MRDPVKLGIVGVGNIAERHAQGYLAMPDLAQIVAVADVIPAVAQAKAEAWHALRWHESLEAMLDHADIDAVDICLPHDLHVSAVQAAAAAGKHIYIEKPMGRTADECRTMMAATTAAGVRLMVGHNLLFNPILERAVSLVAAGYLGKVFMVRGASYGWPAFRQANYRLDRIRAGGGVLIDTGVHLLYLMRAMGGEAQAVSASMSHVLRTEMDGEDNALLTIEYASGALGEAVASYATKLATWQLGFPDGWDQRVEVYGSRGTLKVDLVRGTLQLGVDAGRGIPELAEWRVGSKGIGEWIECVLPNAYFDSFKYAVKGFVESLLADAAPPVEPMDGYRVAQMVDAAYESARTGRKVAIGDV